LDRKPEYLRILTGILTMALTVENCAAYLLPYVKPTMKILDVGCGPGTLTCDFAKLVPQGSVIGLDSSEDSLVNARELAASNGITNVLFDAGNVLSLHYSDGEFDIVHSHRVFHYVDASVALREMRRVTKLGGIIATRDTAHTLYWPPVEELDEFMSMSNKIAKGRGGDSYTGARYRKFAREAGFPEKDTLIKASAWCYSTKSRLESYCSWLPGPMVSG
jgi:ubiquinone/menaquinone biosynthesis C-methylase UbiE